MTVRGTSNGTNKATTRELKCSLYEVAPANDQGGYGAPATGTFQQLREIDNPASGAGTYFTPGDHHLPVGTAQTKVVPV